MYVTPTRASILAAFEQPVPPMERLRHLKSTRGYSWIPISWKDYLHSEPLVPLDRYGIANQAYYSRPNGALRDPIPGLPPELYVRQSIADTLVKINRWLEHPVVCGFFNAELELYVEDAWREPQLQAHLYHDVFPDLIKKWYGLTGPSMDLRRRQFIGVPSTDPGAPSPHVAGAFDVTLRLKRTSRRYVPDVQLPLGYADGKVTEHLFPDYYETIDRPNPAQLEARRHRRAFVALMTGSAFNEDTFMAVNPTEIFHWGTWDQLSCLAAGRKFAYYSVASLPKT